MKKILAAWMSISLVKRIAAGALIGALCGAFLPWATPLGTLGSLFVSALKATAPLLVFFLVATSLSGTRSGRGMKSIVVLFVVSTFLATVVTTAASFLFPLSLTLATPASGGEAAGGIGDVLNSIVMNIVANPLDALAKGNYLGILAWAVVLGIALRVASGTTKGVFQGVSDAISQVIRWVIECAPFGILGLVFTAMAEGGWQSIAGYGKLLVLLVSCTVFVALVVNPVLVFLVVRKNPFPLVLRCLKESGAVAFFTRSSAANIPINLEICRKLGLSKDIYSVSIPLGATINMAGSAVNITGLTLAAAFTLGISVDLPSALLLCAVATVAAAGTSGIAAGSLLLIPLTTSLFGIPNDIAMQIVAIGFIVGTIQDPCETALNSSSDVLFTATAEYRTWQKQGRTFKMGKNLETHEAGNEGGPGAVP